MLTAYGIPELGSLRFHVLFESTLAAMESADGSLSNSEGGVEEVDE